MSTFDPSTLMSMLQQNSGAASGPDVPPLQPPPTPNAPSPIADIAKPPVQVPQAAATQSGSQQQQQRLQGIKGYLSNILHGVGEGMKAHLGMETDAQQQQRLYTQGLQTQKFNLEQQNIQSEILQRAALVKQMQSMVTMPGGYQVPFALAKPYLEAQAKVTAAQIGKRFVVQPNVGMWDTQAEGGPKILPGSDAQGVTVTSEIAQEYHMPQDMVGRKIPLGQFASFERAGAMWAPNVTNRQEVKEVSDPNNPGSTQLVTVPVSSTAQRVSPTGGAVTQPGQAASPNVVPAAPNQNKVPPPGPQNKPPLRLSTQGGVRTLTDSQGNPLQGKSSTDTVYATDPKTGQQIFTTRTEAAAQGLQTPMKVTAVQVRKDQALSNRLADVQRKVGDYASTFDQPIDPQDQQAIAYLMDNNVGAGLNAHGINVNLLPQYVQSQLKARGIQALSDAGMRRYILFNQARESLSGYQQILTNSSRASDKILELQLEQLPPPLADKQFADQATGQFQQNLDLAGQHMPMFPGSSETQQSIKASQLAARGQTAAIQANQDKAQQTQTGQPPRPSNVPIGYIYKANGPKGRGWYKP
jgi:hypothetical protein